MDEQCIYLQLSRLQMLASVANWLVVNSSHKGKGRPICQLNWAHLTLLCGVRGEDKYLFGIGTLPAGSQTYSSSSKYHLLSKRRQVQINRQKKIQINNNEETPDLNLGDTYHWWYASSLYCILYCRGPTGSTLQYVTNTVTLFPRLLIGFSA